MTLFEAKFEMTLRVTILGAGFAGLELSTSLSEALGDELDLTLIDKNDSFVFGFSKLDVMFGRAEPAAVRLPYSRICKPGVKFRQETVTKIDPRARRVETDRATYDADAVVVALGAEYDIPGTPGLAEGGNEFYSVGGAEVLRRRLVDFSGGSLVVAATSTLYKCPPAPCEAALLLSDYLTDQGVRDSCQISLVIPSSAPPPGPASKAFLAALAGERVSLVTGTYVQRIDPGRKTAVLADSSELPFDLFLGIPRHRVPAVVAESGLVPSEWVHVNPKNLETGFPGVYAVGDCTDVEAPMTGVLAEEAARVVAKCLVAKQTGGSEPPPYSGAGSCYFEFGKGRVGRADMDFLSGPHPTGRFAPPSLEIAAEKQRFASSRQARWFGS